MDIAGYLASILIGVILGLLGGGGSILSIPILVYLFKVDPVTASAYSLFIVGTTSLVGAIPKYNSQLIHFRSGLLFGIPSIVAIFATRKWLIPALPDIILTTPYFVLPKRVLLLGLFAILMVLAAVKMLWASDPKPSADQRIKISLLVIQGLLIGFLTGLIGAGGGFLIIPALVLLTRLPFKTAVGTSLFIIAINSLSGFLGDVLNQTIDWGFLLVVTALAISGIFIGNYYANKISASKLRRGFAWFVLISGIWILLKEGGVFRLLC